MPRRAYFAFPVSLHAYVSESGNLPDQRHSVKPARYPGGEFSGHGGFYFAGRLRQAVGIPQQVFATGRVQNLLSFGGRKGQQSVCGRKKRRTEYQQKNQ